MDCTVNCKKKNHGDYLVSALTSGEPVESLEKIINRKCSNPIKNTDSIGRTILHVAASLGRQDIFEWFNHHHHHQLPKNSLQIKDKESGWTALHKAIYYGQIGCAVFLYQLLHDWKSFDNEGHSPLDLVVLDSPRTNKRKKKKERLAIVVLPFESGDAGELTLNTGDILEIFHTNRSGWGVGRLKFNGNRGLFPINFIEELEEAEVPIPEKLLHPQYDAYIWGNNINFTLGLGDSTNRNSAELNETLWEKKLSITEVALTKFHSVFLTDSGQIFTCGHGLSGRLGHDSEETILYPKQIRGLLCYHCIAIAAANHHTIVLSENGEVFTFGSNDFYQLGQTPPPKYCVLPTLISHKSIKGKTIIGIAAARFHSAIHTKDELFTFGLNAGQLGHRKGDEHQAVPKVVSHLYQKDSAIVNVIASDGATLCLLDNGDFYLLQDYVCRKIAMKMTSVIKIAMTGGILKYKGPEFTKAEPLKIAVLRENGVVEVWRSNYTAFKKCYWLGRKLTNNKIIDISLGRHLVVTVNDGQVYFGHFHTKQKNSSSVSTTQQSSEQKQQHSGSGGSSNKVEVLSGHFSLNEVMERCKQERKECDEMHLEKVPFLYRTTKCFCDPKSRIFAVVQHDPRLGMRKYPVLSSATLFNDIKMLLRNSFVDDEIHDVVIKSKSSLNAVHKFILKCRLGDTYDILFPIEKEGIIDCSDIPDEELKTQLESLYEDATDTTSSLGLSIPPFCLEATPENSPKNTEEGNEVADNEFAKQMSGLSMLDFESPYDENAENLTDMKLVKIADNSPYKKKKMKGKKSAYAKYKEMGKYQNAIQKSEKRSKKTSNKIIVKMNSFSDWRKHKDLSDVTIESRDEQLFYCHKCVLIARSDYFSNMLNSDWLESSVANHSTIKLPIPGDILSIILDFFYTGMVKKFHDVDDITFIGEVLVYSDQLLILRLRELCEYTLAEKVNLKNAVEIFQFSCTYNAHQLKVFTSEFIALNLAYYLEIRLLEDLSSDDSITFSEQYRTMVVGMDTRKIEPSNYHLEMDKKEKEFQQVLKADLIRLKAQRRRSSSSSSINKNGLSNSESDNVSSPPLTSKKLDPNSEDVFIVSSREANVRDSASISKVDVLSKSPNGENSRSHDTKTRVDLKAELTTKTTSSDKKKQFMVSPFKKKSQKERRREISECTVADTSVSSSIDEVKNNVVCPWGSPSPTTPPVKSFKELLTEETNPSKYSTKKTNWQRPKSKNKQRLGNSISEEEQAVERNPWQKITAPTKENFQPVNSSSELSKYREENGNKRNSNEFASILQVQQEEKQRQIRESRKPLTAIQLEERAMEELKKYYEKNACQDEHITVTRVKKTEGMVPFWDRVMN